MKKSNLKKIYKYNETRKQFELEISLDYYKEMFNEWDAAPLRKKDLDPELVDYLENAAIDIPLKHDVLIHFIMPKNVKNSEMEEITRKVFRNYFMFLVHLNQRKIMKLFRKAILFGVLGFLMITLAYLFVEYDTIPFEIFTEGVFIGGWVFIWETISLLFFHIYDLRSANKRYLRFNNSKIEYTYK